MKFFHIVDRIESASHRWNKVIMGFGAILIVLIMLLVVADVSGRYFINSPIECSIEIEQIMLAYVAFLAFAFGLINGNHLRVSLFFNRFPGRMKVGAEVLAGLAGFIFFVLVTRWGIEFFWSSWTIREVMPASIPLPFWLPKFAVPLGALLITIQFLIYMLKHVGILLSGQRES